MILHNILIIGLTWLLTNMVLGIVLAIEGIIIGIKNRHNDYKEIIREYFADCEDKLEWYYKMPIMVQWLLLPVDFTVDIGVGLYYIFN